MARLKKGIKPEKRDKFRWSDDLLVPLYEYARQGMTLSSVASTLGCALISLQRVLDKNSVARKLWEEGQKRGKKDNFKDIVYGTLPKRLQKLWDQIIVEFECNPLGNWGKKFLRGFPRRVKQHLFLYAFFHTNFNLTRSCQIIGISREAVKYWAEDDGAFAELLQGIMQCKKDFFENALMDLVREGNPHAVIFVNRTINRDRGYNEKHTVDLNINSTTTVKIDDLNLPLETRMEILQAIRAQRGEQARLPAPSDVTDAEFEEVKE